MSGEVTRGQGAQDLTISPARKANADYHAGVERKREAGPESRAEVEKAEANL
jgi:hypothetical protein